MQTPLIFEDVLGMAGNWCKTLKPRGRLRNVQPSDLFVSGFSCKDVSNYNVSRLKHSNHIATGRGSTGGTFSGVRGYVVHHGPTVLLLENVRGL